MSDGYAAATASINGNAHLLVEIAGLLHAGRLDGDAATMARAPRSHPEVGKAVDDFARFAHDQYQDLTTLLVALATKLRTTGRNYVTVDQHTQAELDRVLTAGRYVAPQDR